MSLSSSNLRRKKQERKNKGGDRPAFLEEKKYCTSQGKNRSRERVPNHEGGRKESVTEQTNPRIANLHKKIFV